MRYGPNTVIVNLPDVLPQIYHRKADKTEFYSPKFGAPTTLSTMKHEDYMVTRRMVVYGVRYLDACA